MSDVRTKDAPTVVLPDLLLVVVVGEESRRPGEMSKQKPTIAELEAMLGQEESQAIVILPNGEVRQQRKRRKRDPKVLTMRENLGGEYAVGT